MVEDTEASLHSYRDLLGMRIEYFLCPVSDLLHAAGRHRGEIAFYGITAGPDAASWGPSAISTAETMPRWQELRLKRLAESDAAGREQATILSLLVDEAISVNYGSRSHRTARLVAG